MLWMIGAGSMARDYIDVLTDTGIDFITIGRSQLNCDALSLEKGVNVISGGLDLYLSQTPEIPDEAIVAVDVEDLYGVAVSLLNFGVKRILLEKPGGIDFLEINALEALASKVGARVFIAYNRRFYSSVIEAKKIIAADGGVKSFHFEFTEWSDSIAKLPKSESCKNNWLLANSSHVIDLAFYIGGAPKKMHSFVQGSGELEWYDKDARFSGSGVSTLDATFSYCANWDAPGRWSLEFMTPRYRLIFRPMELLHIQNRNSVVENRVEIDDHLDKRYKPGLYNQVRKFIAADECQALLELQDLASMNSCYDAILLGGEVSCDSA